MSSCSVCITVSSGSRVVVFSGNLLKAPPLNRRGRKKWHERYLVLRANKTIEIYKSRKAAEALKTPRRVIDLRECISLELGLEYKNLQYVLSLGTFKRTFFLAAPSDPLMLQWGNVLQKVKSAQEGEIIEILDIGLRNSRNFNAVHRIRSSPSTQQISSTPASPARYQGNLYHKGVSKSSYAISSYGRDSNGISVRSSGNIGYTSYYTGPKHHSYQSSSQESPIKEQAGIQEGDLLGHSRRRVPRDSVSEVAGANEQRNSNISSSNTNSAGTSPSHILPLSTKVPPPNIMVWGSTGGKSPRRDATNTTNATDATSARGENSEEGDENRWKSSSREFVVREGLLHRSRAVREQSPKNEGSGGRAWQVKKGRRGGRSSDVGMGRDADRKGGNEQMSNKVGSDAGQGPSSTLKQSQHYRKIDLIPERPLFSSHENDAGSSGEESDSTVSEVTGKFYPGVVPLSPSANKRFHTGLPESSLFSSPSPSPFKFGSDGRRRNFSGPLIPGGRINSSGSPLSLRERLERRRGEVGWGGEGVLGGWRGSDQYETEVGRSRFYRPLSSSRTSLPSFMSHRVHSLEDINGHISPRINNYCQVAIGEKDEDALFGITAQRAGIASRKLTDILSKPRHPFPSSLSPGHDFQLPTPHAGSPFEEDIEGEEKEAAVAIVGDNADFPYLSHFDPDIQLSPPFSPLFDDYKDGNTFDLLVRDRDTDFNYSPTDQHPPDDDIIIAPPESFVLHGPRGDIKNEMISEEGELSDSERTGNDPQSVNERDRNSTESNDTGYTSGHGASPGGQDKKNLSTVAEFGAVETDSSLTPSSSLVAPSTSSFMTSLSTAPPSSISVGPKSTTSNGIPEDVLPDLNINSIRSSQSNSSFRNSQSSLSSVDSVRCYVPLVFQKGGGGRGGGGAGGERAGGRNRSSQKGVSIFIVICLVENSDHFIKELLSQKVCGGYKVVECEGEVGKSVVSMGDDFTVETALEDLEFGFSITTSTQKDVYINKSKVREFHFQITNLFGCRGKPFSCDVEIRHANQITVLPIEIETKI